MSPGLGKTSGTGVLTAEGRLLELAGNLRLQGMARSELTGTELVQLSALRGLSVCLGGAVGGRLPSLHRPFSFCVAHPPCAPPRGDKMGGK